MTTTTFTVGKTYTVRGNLTIAIARRTEKSVWFMNWDGVETRRKIETDTFLKTEFVRYDERNVANACDVVAETIETDVIETETATETLTANERRAMIDSFNYYATQLNTAEYGSPKWDSIWDKMQVLKAFIK